MNHAALSLSIVDECMLNWFSHKPVNAAADTADSTRGSISIVLTESEYWYYLLFRKYFNLEFYSQR